jgi:hypothetical protein
MSIYQLSNDELLTLGTRILENAQAPPIQEAMARVGYDEAAFQRGQALRDAFADAVQTRQTEYGEQIGATEALNDAWDAFHSQTYMPHVTIARLVFDGQVGTIRRLGVDGIRPNAFDAYLQEARRFYDTIAGDGALQAALAERGVDDATVTQARRPTSTSWRRWTRRRSARRRRRSRPPAPATTPAARPLMGWPMSSRSLAWRWRTSPIWSSSWG